MDGVTTLTTPLELLRRSLSGRSGLRPLDTAGYARAHRTYEAHSDQRALLTDWLGTTLAAVLPARAGLSVLSIGPGDGSVDGPLAESSSPARPGLRWVGAEPNAAVGARCRERVRAALGPTGDVVLHAGPFGTLAETVGDESFDLVLAVHSLYYVPDLTAALTAVAARLAPGGAAVLALAPWADLNQLTTAVDPTSHSWWSGDLPAALATAGLVPTTTRLTGRLDVTDCLDPASAAGREVLDFLVGADCSGLDDVTRGVLLDALTAIGHREGDRVLVPHPVDVVVAR